MFEQLQLELASENCIYSYGFFNRILQAVCEDQEFIIELQENGSSKPVWFCWRVWEKPTIDRSTLRWVKYSRIIEQDYNIDAFKKSSYEKKQMGKV